MKLGTGRLNLNTIKLTSIILCMTIGTFSYGNPFEVKTVFFNSFEIKVENNSIEMTWMCTEYNNKNFVIQQSLNGTDWEDIGFIASKNSPESLVGYSFKQSNTAPGRHYYRIKHTDIDLKKIGYSPIKTITITEEKQNISVWPNPAKDVVNVTNSSKGMNRFTIGNVFDLSGRKVLDIKLGEGMNTINISTLPAGTYLLYLENNDGNSFNQKIIKQ
jgi:Secretion system C-terminal sorting domain